MAPSNKSDAECVQTPVLAYNAQCQVHGQPLVDCANAASKKAFALVDLQMFVKRLRRKAADARRLANHFQNKGAFEAYKCSLGESLAYNDSASRIEKLLQK